MLCEEEEVRGRWKQYLIHCIQNRNGNDEEVQAEESRHEQVSVEEVRCSIQKLKNRKASEDCGITGEMLKASGEVVVQWLHNIINLAWRSGSVPADWQKALTVPIHKKGSRTQCKNYCGISALSIPGKVHASVLEKRMRRMTEGKVLEEQGAFQNGRSCACGTIVHHQAVRREGH